MSAELNDVSKKVKSKKLILKDVAGKSKIWKAFGYVFDPATNKTLNFVSCKTCFKCFKYISHQTGTTHLLRHIDQCDKTATGMSNQQTLKFFF